MSVPYSPIVVWTNRVTFGSASELSRRGQISRFGEFVSQKWPTLLRPPRGAMVVGCFP